MKECPTCHFQGFLPPMLVFVQSIERARELFHELVYEGINVDVIHAERTQQQVHTITRNTLCYESFLKRSLVFIVLCGFSISEGQRGEQFSLG